MTSRTKAALAALALVALAGVVFSGLLYYSSIELAAGVTNTSLCEIGGGLSCAPALSSEYASLLGIPLPAFSGAYYFALLGLLISLLLTKREERADHLPVLARFVTLTFALSVVASIGLAYVAFFVLPVPCPFCIGLYGVNALGLAIGFVLEPRLGEFFSSLGSSLSALVRARAVQSAVLVFGVAVAMLAISYSWSAQQLRQANQEAQRERGEQAASELESEGEVEVDPSGLPRLGPEDASIVIVEFSDFQCPFCSRFAQTLHEVHEAYPDQVAIYFAHFPLDGACNPGAGAMHPFACLAARAAVCGQEQEAFWPMHDAIFAHFEAARGNGEHGELTEAQLVAFAEQSGMAAEPFGACMKADSTGTRILEQVKLARRVGVRSTPTWVINGHVRKGASGFAYVQPQIERLLVLQQAAAPKPPATTPVEPAIE